MPAKHPIPPPLFLGCYAAFFVLGMYGAMIGPAKDTLAQSLGVAIERGGLLVSAQFAGATVGAYLAGHLSDRLDIRWILCGAGGLLAGGLTLFALADHFGLALAATVIMGLGMGGFGAGPNILFATAGLKRPAVWLNLLNGVWGIGSACGPQLVQAALDQDRLDYAYYGAAALAAALLPVFWRNPLRLPARGAAGASRGLGWRPYLPFALVFVAYVGAEAGMGAWIFTQVTKAAGAGTTHATLAASMFWGGLTLSRMAAIVVLRRVREHRLLTGCALTIAAGALAMVLFPKAENVAVAAAFLVGLGCGPIFPTTYGWVIRALPATTGATLATLQALGSVGAVLVPALQGYAGGGKDGGMIVIVALGVAMAAMFRHLTRQMKRAGRGEGTAPAQRIVPAEMNRGETREG